VVLMNGSALSVNWINEHANAILDAWYPGEEGGAAVAETLSGKNNPAGRLPVTFYIVLPQTEMLPKNFACFCPKSDVDCDENLSTVRTFLQDTCAGW